MSEHNVATYLPMITKDGKLRASKPKDGNAAYIWRMVAFSVSTNPKHHCMPMTADFGVHIPDDYLPEAPSTWLEEQVASTLMRPSDIDFCMRQAGSVYEYHVRDWVRHARRRYFIKNVLDPIVNQIVDSVPVTQQTGTMRWARAFGVI